jgi:hypothetical protein
VLNEGVMVERGPTLQVIGKAKDPYNRRRTGDMIGSESMTPPQAPADRAGHRAFGDRDDRPLTNTRRVYLAQYSKEIIPSKDGTTTHRSFDPFLTSGQYIATH